MTCETMTQLMSAALDGELTADEKAQLDRHLAQCDRCRALFDELSAIHAACDGLEAVPPPALREKILNHLPPQQKPAAKVIPLWRRWAAMAAVFALIALAAWRLPRSIFTQPRATVPQSPAQEKVLADTALPTADTATDPAGAADTNADNEAAATYNNSITEEIKDSAGGDRSYYTFQGDEATLSEEEFGAMSDRVLKSSSDSEEPVPAPLPDYVDDPVNVNAVPQKRAYGSSSSPQSAKVAATESAVNEDMDTTLGTASGGGAAPDEPPMAMATFRMDASQLVNGDGEILEPMPEIAPDEIVAATLFLDASNPSYCGVLTLSGGALLNNYPAQVQPNGETWYELPRAAFYALVDELTSAGVSLDLRSAGDHVSPAAETGLVVISS